MGNYGKAQETMDGQLWQSSGNDGWATMAMLRQRWLGNYGNAQATMDGQLWQSSGNDGWATMAKLR